MFSEFATAIQKFISEMGITTIVTTNDGWKYIVMIGVACVLLYLAIAKGFEPLLLVPIAFGMLLVNLPNTGIHMYNGHGGVKDLFEFLGEGNGGLLDYLGLGKELGIFPPLIFVGIGAMTDFGPLIANPKSLLLGGAAQLGIFFAFLGALLLGFDPSEASSIGIIGGADGPTAIYLTTKLAPHLLGSVAVAAYSYMALVPVIQPPIMKALTTKEQRMVKMEQLRQVSRLEKIVFPVAVTVIVSLLLPSAGTLVGMLMFGNLLKEAGCTNRLAEVASNGLMSVITIMLGLVVGATTSGDTFITWDTIKVVILGLTAFCVGTAGGVLFGKIMYYTSGKKINPLIGAAGVSAVPMAARVAQKVGQEECPSNFLLMHAMGPNVAGVIGSAIAAGILLSIYGN
ncbi:sodium ion-translocating decarboxylase, beta subunit [Cellulosilyticum lentocellum DSM 5427]|uniref:Sodium ion-translocating decarboxylase, beta subunit n=2 Tax=Cellulosilyticum lentocellum TaxID=29360 RepID=F2JS39_CELLD|nr:sodium ion-translocating decarboxylase subunit beta [Cellulosilyticum lentocellum]ADZ83976.1 sodium ion-translocating decarboxylase, beta subunit [Cellulosilyticum lentocellum DSM 5427]